MICSSAQTLQQACLPGLKSCSTYLHYLPQSLYHYHYHLLLHRRHRHPPLPLPRCCPNSLHSLPVSLALPFASLAPAPSQAPAPCSFLLLLPSRHRKSVSCCSCRGSFSAPHPPCPLPPSSASSSPPFAPSPPS